MTGAKGISQEPKKRTAAMDQGRGDQSGMKASSMKHEKKNLKVLRRLMPNDATFTVVQECTQPPPPPGIHGLLCDQPPPRRRFLLSHFTLFSNA